MARLRNKLRILPERLRPWRILDNRIISIRLVGVTVLAALSTYLVICGVGAIETYHGKRNAVTSLVERIAPLPAVAANGESISVRRVRFEAAARYHYAQKKPLAVTEQETYALVLKQQQSRLLYEQELRKRGLLPTEQQITAELDALYKQAACLKEDGSSLTADSSCKGDLATGRDRLALFLTMQYGDQVTLTDFRRWTTEALYESIIQRSVLSQVEVSHILIAIPDNASNDVIEQRRKLAADIKGKITDTTKFADFAKQYSEDVASRDKGGALGSTSKGSDAPIYSGDFEDAIFTLPVNSISDPVRSPYGWHIIQVTKRTGTENLSLAKFTDKLVAESKAKILLPVPVK